MIDFPASPTNGQQFSANGVTWTWDGFKWVPAGAKSGGVYLPLAGGTMLGDITLVSDPTAPLHPVTKQMLDKQSNVSHENRIINGDMRIDQRNNGAFGVASGYTVDRWMYSASQTNKGSWQRLASGAFGFPYALAFIASSAFTPAATDFFQFQQPIEADMVSDFAWGTTNAQPVTLSFVAQSSLTGTFGGSIKNAAGNRSYPFSYSLPTAGTPTKISVTIPGDTAGAWVMSGNAASLYVLFDLGVGATYRGPAGAWAGTTYNGATGSVSVVAVNGASFSVTGVKLEVGSVATPFNRQSLAKSIADCQRYYQTAQGGVNGYASGVMGISTFVYLATMRAAPTIVVGSVLGTDVNATLTAPDVISAGGFRTQANSVATGAVQALRNFTASAEL